MIVVISGASQSGKTTWTRKAYGKARRAFAWDPEEQWGTLPGWTHHRTVKSFAAAALQPGPGRHAFTAPATIPMADAFDFWAQCCFLAVDRHGETVCIAEELSDVTHPGKAPPHWGMLIRRGLKRGAIIPAISQRWAEADKTALGNASKFVIFRQSSADDTRYLTRKTRVPAAAIDGLKPFEFVIYDAATQTFQRGKVAR